MLQAWNRLLAGLAQVEEWGAWQIFHADHVRAPWKRGRRVRLTQQFSPKVVKSSPLDDQGLTVAEKQQEVIQPAYTSRIATGEVVEGSSPSGTTSNTTEQKICRRWGPKLEEVGAGLGLG